MKFINSDNFEDDSINDYNYVLNDLRNYGFDFIDLTNSNPMKLDFTYNFENLQKSFIQEKIMDYNPDPQGSIESRTAIQEYYKDKNRDLEVEDIFLTTGSSESISFILKSITKPKDEILVPQPGYPLYETIANFENVKVQFYNFKFEKIEKNKLKWKLDFDSLEKNISKKTKILFLTEPNNPGGFILDEEDRNKLSEFVLKHNLILLIDEVFADYYPKYYQNDSWKNLNRIYLNGLSKSFGLPQFKLSWIIISGENDFCDEMNLALEIVSDTYLSLNKITDSLLPKILFSENQIQIQIKNLIHKNKIYLSRVLKNSPNIEYYFPDGGWNLLLEFKNVTEYEDDEELSIKLLLDKLIISYAGYLFDLNGFFLVISLLTKPEVFKEGIKKIIEFSLKA